MKIAPSITAIVFLPLATQSFAVESTLSAQRSPIQGYAELMVTSSYISRGRTIQKGPALEPMIKATVSGLSVGIWGYKSFETKEGGINNEVDFLADYTKSFEPVTLTLSTIQARYPDQEELGIDQEVSIKANFNAPLKPRFSINRGVAGAPEGFMYYDVGATQDLYARGKFASQLGATLGYSDRPEAPDGLRHLTFTASASYDILSATANYIVETDKNVNNLQNQDRFYVTTAAGYAF